MHREGGSGQAMKTVLVTGGIASGKSEVCRYLASKGYPTYDCDSRTKALYESVPGLKRKVEEATSLPFGEIGAIFSDPAKREALEAVVYPEVLKDLEAWKGGLNCRMAFVESAIMLEKPLFNGCYDTVLLVRAPMDARLGRNPRTAERAASQHLPDEADYMIDNDSDLETLHSRIDIFLNDMKTDLSKILAVSGKHGLYRFLAISRGNAVVAEKLSDSSRTMLDSRSRITTLADVAIYTAAGELKLKEVFLAIEKALDGAEAPAAKGDDAAVKALFDKAVPDYDPERFYTSHMRKIVDWYTELVKYASLDFTEEEEDEK